MIAVLSSTAGHVQGIVDLILPIQQQEFGIAVTIEGQPDLLDIDGFYRPGAGNFWVAVDDTDRVVGTIALKDIGAGQAALRKMFVHAEYRGRERGVAQRLLDTLLAWAHERGLREVFLGTTEAFRAAHRFYEKNGFELWPAESLPAAFPRMAVDTRFYRRAATAR